MYQMKVRSSVCWRECNCSKLFEWNYWDLHWNNVFYYGFVDLTFWFNEPRGGHGLPHILLEFSFFSSCSFQCSHATCSGSREKGGKDINRQFFWGILIKGLWKESCNGVLQMKRGDFRCFFISFPQGHALETHMCITFLCSSSVTE